jgi:hypothetical protein
MKHCKKIRSQRKAQEGHLDEGKSRKPNKNHEKRQTKPKWQEELRKAQKHKNLTKLKISP